jgi:hypothetical protein
VTTSKSVKRSVAVLTLPKPVPAIITYAQRIVTAMTGNPAFVSPSPTLASVQTSIVALQAAEASALARTKGAVTSRNDKKAALVATLQLLKGYVQSVADADPENSAAAIQGAGMAVRKTPVHKPRVFNAVQGAVSGSVKIVTASGGRRVAYDWEYSIDGGKTSRLRRLEQMTVADKAAFREAMNRRLPFARSDAALDPQVRP